MNIFCIADIHGEAGKLKALFEKTALFQEIEAIIVAGDITHFGDYKQAKQILQPVLEIGCRILAIPGNCDKSGVDTFLDEAGINLHGKGVILNEVGFIGLGGSNPTPHHTPNEYPEEKLNYFLEQGFREISDCPVKVLISHTPPAETDLDKLKSGLHVGSYAVRNFLLEKEIDICISAHIHESAGRCKLGKTDCFYGGAFRDGKYNFIEINTNGLKILRSEL